MACMYALLKISYYKKVKNSGREEPSPNRSQVSWSEDHNANTGFKAVWGYFYTSVYHEGQTTGRRQQVKLNLYYIF